MKILFIGTSAAWPLPRLNCQCQICTSKNPKDKRLRSTILINDSILVDCGPDFYHQARKILGKKISLIKYLFLTHSHPDHSFGLQDLHKIYNKDQPIKVFLYPSCKTDLDRIKSRGISFFISQYHKLTLSKMVKINHLTVTPFLVEHTNTKDTLGFLFKEKKLKMVYIPDFREIPKNSKKYLKEANLAILDGANIYPIALPGWGHMPIIESIKLAKKLKIKQVYYTHIGHGPRMFPHRKLEEFVQKLGGKNFHIAYDGLELII